MAGTVVRVATGGGGGGGAVEGEGGSNCKITEAATCFTGFINFKIILKAINNIVFVTAKIFIYTSAIIGLVDGLTNNYTIFSTFEFYKA